MYFLSNIYILNKIFMKICKHCNEEKELCEFVGSKLTLDGTISTCKNCSSKKRLLKRYEVTLEEKQCFCCKKIKKAEEFPKNISLMGGLHTWCKECSNTKNKDAKYYKISNEKRKLRRKEDEIFRNEERRKKRVNRTKNIKTSLFHSCKTRAEQKGLEFNITKDDIIIPEFCPILLKPIICGDKENYQFSPSVDRIDNTKGYIKGNIQVISMKANKIKNDATIEELILFSKWIDNYIKTIKI